MDKVKRFDLLINALALCHMPHLRLTLLGAGSLRQQLEKLVEKNGISGQVRFVGFQKNPYPFFAQADLFVSCSSFEGFPNVVLESIACRTPVIATLSPGGTKEIIENVDGCVLVKNNTVYDLAEAIKKYPYGKRLSPCAIEPYKIAAIIKQYENILI
jgi:glycosyltransferase involved in cell wall biosynthesis